MVLAYQGGDKLKVPVEAFDRVQKYASAEGARPVVDKLGSGSWDKIKKRVKKAMRDMAAELLKLYAERKARPGHAFTGESPWQREFEESLRVRGDAATRRRPSRDVMADMSDDVAHGPAGLRRRRLRQDRGGHARGHARRARRQAGGGAGPHHHPRLPALEDLPQALRALPGHGGDGLALPHRRRRSRRCWPAPPRARWTSSSAPTASSPRTSSSATSACSSSTRSSASGWRPRRS